MSNILIVRLSSIGDVLLCTPVARQIKRHHPDSHLAWVVQPKALPVIAGNPHLDEIAVVDVTSPASWLATIHHLWRRFDIVVDLHCRLKSSFLTWLTRARTRIGKTESCTGGRWCFTELAPVSLDHLYIPQLYLEECAALGLDIDDYQTEFHPADADREAAEALWRQFGLGGGQPVVALLPFSNDPTREWPTERYGELGDRLAQQTGARCVILGSAAEVPRADRLAGQMASGPIVLAGRTSLGQAAAALSRCDLAVGGDTGLTHFAFALSVPLVCALGPSPLVDGPKGDKAVSLTVPCEHRPCSRRSECRRAPDRRCMRELGVEQVEEAALRLLAH